MTASSTNEPQPPHDPLRIDLALEGSDGDRWRVRVGLRPSEAPVFIDGATVALTDDSGRLLGPAVVLPVAGQIADYVELHTRVQGPGAISAGTQLRCTAFFSSGRDPQIADQDVAPRRGFASWLQGKQALDPGEPPQGRALNDEEIEALRGAWPGLFLAADADDAAFSVFQEDLLSSMDLDEHDSITEEILRMLKED
jgi:hypothetical protein